MFAAITVVIALLGLLLLGLSFMQGVALGAATAVLATMFAALTIIPALIGGLGRVHGRRAPRVRPRAAASASGSPSAASTSRARAPRPPAGAAASASAPRARLGALVARRAAPPVDRGHPSRVALLLALALPATQHAPGLQRRRRRPAGLDDARGLRPDRPGLRRRHQRLVPARGRAGQEGRQGRGRSRSPPRCSDDKDFTFVAPPSVSPDGALAIVTAYPRTGPQDAATTDTLNRLRDDVVPAVERQTGAQIEVGGFTASNEDFSRRGGEQAAALRRRRRAASARCCCSSSSARW